LTVGSVDFPQSRFHFYKITINNQGKPPLRVTGARLFDRVEPRAERRRQEARIVSSEHDSKTRQTRVIFDLVNDRLPSVGLTLDINFDGFYYRPINLEATDEFAPRTNWRPVASGQVYRIDRQGVAAEVRHIDSPAATGSYLRLTITDGDDLPLDVTGATAFSIETVLVAEGRHFQDPARTAALFAGNPRLGAPSYDLARTAGSIAVNSLPELHLGLRETNPLFKGPSIAEGPWTEQHQPILWTGVIVGVLVLGGLTVLLLKRSASISGNEGM